MALPLRPRGRVPGHQPAPVRAGRCARRRGALLRRRRVPVDLSLPPRGRRGLPRAPRPQRRGARPDAELPLAPGDPRGRQPPVRHRVRHRLRAARRRRALPRAGRAGRRAARHRQGRVQGRRTPLARGRVEARRPAREGARRIGRGDAGRDRAPLRRGHGRRALRGGAALRGPADLSRRRPRLLRPAAGRRSDRVPAPAPEPLRRRGARDRARVAVRRRLERRARFAPPLGRTASALRRPRAGASRRDLPEGRAALRGVPAALRPARPHGRAGRPRAAVRADRGRARLRPGGARAVERAPPLRKSAQARAPGPGLRIAARPGHRGLRRLPARPGGGRCARGRGGRGGGGRRLGAPAHRPCGEGARVQGGRARRRGPHPAVACSGRDPVPPRRALRVPRRQSGDRQAGGRVRLGRRPRGGTDRRPGREPAAPLRGHDARDRPPDRLGRDRPDEPARRERAAPLDPQAARGRDRRGRRPVGASSAATPGLRFGSTGPRRRATSPSRR